MTLVYTVKLSFQIRCTNVDTQKIDGFIFKMFEIVLASFQVDDKLRKAWFFQKTFLVVGINVKVVLEIFFLTFSNVDIKSFGKELIWRFYTTTKALPTTKQIEFIDKKEFVKMTLNENFKTFMMHIVILEASVSRMIIHLLRVAQIAALK